MNIDNLYDLVKDFFGYKANMRYKDPKKRQVACILYDSFWFVCSLDDQYNRFGAGIGLGTIEGILTDFLGKRCSLNSDEKSIRKSLQIIDDYCRLRLPDKFLKAYDSAYALS